VTHDCDLNSVGWVERSGMTWRYP